MALSTFTWLCTCPYHLSSELFHFSHWNLVSIQQWLLTLPPTPSPWEPPLYFLSLWIDYSRYKWNHTIFWVWRIVLKVIFLYSSHVVVYVKISFLRLDNILLHVYVTFYLHIHLWWTCGCFSPLSIVSNAAVWDALSKLTYCTP